MRLLDGEGDPSDLAVCLGGDGTMLRALTRFLDTGVPVIGANFGRVGFLTAIPGSELEAGMARVFAGEYDVVSLPTLEIEVGGRRFAAVNDAVVVSGTPGRIIEIQYLLDGEDLGTQPCDGLLCATPPGSTAYNLSNGGPVLVWGLDAAVVTFVAPHTLHARPLVVRPRVRAGGRQPYPGRPGGRPRRRPRGRVARGRGGGHRAVRSQPDDARDASRADLLPPLRPGLRDRLTAGSTRFDRSLPRHTQLHRGSAEQDVVGTLWMKFPEVDTMLSRLLT